MGHIISIQGGTHGAQNLGRRIAGCPACPGGERNHLGTGNQPAQGDRAITIRPRTRLLSSQSTLPSLRNLHVGERIIALGQPTELGQWVAGLVFVAGANPLSRNGIRGEVTAINPEDGTMSLSTVRRGEIAVLTEDQTRYRIPGVEQPGIGDIQVGDTVVVVGRLEPGSASRFQARGIALLPQGDQDP
jgi:hypothetical protein